MNLIEQLRRDESVERFVYPDSKGIPTIGVGRNLRDVGLSDDEIDYLLNNDVAKVRQQLAVYPWYAGLDDVRKGAIENMCFNLGISGLLHFPSMIHALSVKDWQGAHDQALDSLWAKQVGKRADRLAKQLLTGEWQ